MKKFGLLMAGGIAALILIGNIGPMLALAISITILYFVYKQFIKANSNWEKAGWGIIGLAALLASASNIPAIIGIAAAYVLYLVYKNWNKTKQSFPKENHNDPFANFEKQWAEINKK
ncbi:flagellar basal body rod protein [Cytobacillus gottheilii]|uniref:Flagellar basal body rod protein n=1 Tax=Cytobacillus gottheilii TaxID=859144 RepID=A0ABX8FD21_9BACI|nr:flagellar basal body rod protein [Cytobacillus gottheilii]QVY62271.1 flagellar basal body rod protein [Cytobacillus gottheilii]